MAGSCSCSDPSVSSVKQLFYRPIIAGAVLLSLAVIAMMAAFIMLSWRNLERIHRVESTVSQVNNLQDINHRLQAMLLDHPDPRQLEQIRRELTAHMPTGPEVIPSVLKSLLEPSPGKNDLESAIRQLQNLLAEENRRERDLLSKVVEDTELELETGLLGMTILILLLALGAILARRWLIFPLKRMNALLMQLADGRFEPINTDDSTPPWRTLLDNYNHLVNRLAELEQIRRDRTEQLESQVRQATSALLAQNHDLVRAERLAAVGELAAGLAHELRNPLAGIRVALHNLRTESRDQDTQHRFDLIISELERLSRHLNQLLDQARHQPEPLRLVDLRNLAEETLELLHYQLPASIQLHVHIPSNIRARLPETGLRQVLINLVLNAAQVLGQEGGNIWITLKKQNDRLRLEVADDGPGFPNELLSHGIRPFISGRDSGTGLGLLMVKRFVTNLDGLIRLKNINPHGALVILEIPCIHPY